VAGVVVRHRENIGRLLEGKEPPTVAAEEASASTPV
jgi:hypothetical protein